MFQSDDCQRHQFDNQDNNDYCFICGKEIDDDCWTWYSDEDEYQNEKICDNCNTY
jgi:hypothetical protein